jgi:Spy/CpxP family protein refolding chaperone
MNDREGYSMKATILFAALTLVAGLASADGHREGPGKKGDRLKRMQEHLQLTDEQVEQIREIRSNGGSREDVRAVLNEEQIQLMEEHRARRATHGGPHPHGGGEGRKQPAEQESPADS